MKKTILLSLLLISYSAFTYSQSFESFADSVRIAYGIPELNYAIVKSDSIIEMKALGSKKHLGPLNADLKDRFRLGSNTKPITSYIAAVTVQKGLIKWDTKFFDLYPELKKKSNKAYYEFTLADFTCLQANLVRWTYTNSKPKQRQIKGNEKQQQLEFVKWILKQKPIKEKKSYYFSNPSYGIVALMLEKATGKDFNQLVMDLGNELAVNFQFGQPNYKDTNQTWGHDYNSIPENPSYNYKLNWLNAAGNINMTLPDYAKFIQMQLDGLRGNSTFLTKEDFNQMHYGLPVFSYGWKWFDDAPGNEKYSYHIGNPGTFLTAVYLCRDLDIAYIFFMNIQSEMAENAKSVLFQELNKKYSR
ncbi:MAG: serine hydrolase [Crocinitomicaceae bacterium]